jgi:hypothetical protein
MGRVRDIMRSPFAFLFTTSREENLVAEHLIREHHRGRALTEILQDAYVTNRLASDQVDRVLERNDVLQAFGEDMVAEQRAGRTP